MNSHSPLQQKTKLIQEWNRILARVRGIRSQPERALLEAVLMLENHAAPSAEALPRDLAVAQGFPFDAFLLKLSPLYRQSRQRFIAQGGQLIPSLQSSARSLGSLALLDPRIEYTPWENQLRWLIHEPARRRVRGDLLALKSWGGSLFHEQNHRILWRFLAPPPPVQNARRATPEMRRYLNFAESLVIALDFALGDELYPVAEIFWQTHALYDPGSPVRSEGRSQLGAGRARTSRLAQRAYRNYLHAAVYATYLTLEMYDPKKIPLAVGRVFSGPSLELALRAAARAVQLDEKFVVTTNRIWQQRNALAAQKALSAQKALPRTGDRSQKAPLVIPADPLIQHEQYLIAETWFELWGL